MNRSIDSYVNESLTWEKVRNNIIIGSLVRLGMIDLILDRHKDLVFHNFTSRDTDPNMKTVQLFLRYLPYVHPDIKAMIVYVMESERIGSKSMVLRRNNEGNIFIDRGMITIGKPTINESNPLCETKDLFYLRWTSLGNGSKFLQEYSQIVYNINSWKDFEKLIMSGNTVKVRNGYMNKELAHTIIDILSRNGSRWDSIDDIDVDLHIDMIPVYRAIFIKLKALTMMKDILHRYPPEGCRRSIRPLRVVYKGDVMFLMQS